MYYQYRFGKTDYFRVLFVIYPKYHEVWIFI